MFDALLSIGCASYAQKPTHIEALLVTRRGFLLSVVPLRCHPVRLAPSCWGLFFLMTVYACYHPAQAGGVNVCAFLDMLAFAEIGKLMLSDPRTDNGYRVIVGSLPSKLILMDDYHDHPNRLVRIRKGLSSTAVGRYQQLTATGAITVRYWRCRILGCLVRIAALSSRYASKRRCI